MSQTSRSFKPNNYTGTPTLLNETKNIQLYRVSEETKRKVSEESMVIKQRMIDHNQRSRKNTIEKEKLRLRKNEEFREKVKEKWRKKYEDSPLGVDLAEQEEQRLARRRKKLQQQRIEKAKYATVAAMIGTSKFDKASEKEVMESFDEAELRLALQLRKQINDDEIVKKERLVLDGMLAHEMVEIANKFDKVIKPGLRAVAETREKVYGSAASETLSRIYFGSSSSVGSSNKKMVGEGNVPVGLDAHSSIAAGQWESVKFSDGTRGLINDNTAVNQNDQSNNQTDDSHYAANNDHIHSYEYDDGTDGNSSTFRGPTLGFQKFEDDLDKEFELL